jgi:hypothetical protein
MALLNPMRTKSIWVSEGIEKRSGERALCTVAEVASIRGEGMGRRGVLKGLCRTMKFDILIDNRAA